MISIDFIDEALQEVALPKICNTNATGLADGLCCRNPQKHKMVRLAVVIVSNTILAILCKLSSLVSLSVSLICMSYINFEGWTQGELTCDRNFDEMY